MRLIVIAAISALGLGLLSMSGASATPANGVAIGQAASTGQITQQVWWYRYRWRRWGYRRWWRRW